MEKCYWCKKKAEYSAIFNFGKLNACEEHSFRFALVAHLQPDKRVKLKVDAKSWKTAIASKGTC